ncbi:killer toxin, kp4 [Paraphoma chrysanthemicola]|nr:killer toxin, kp4 [Paraphoma chrysanthemicola]
MLNINCRGSGWCTSACGRNIWQVKAFVDTIADSKEFSNKQRLACVKCDGKDGGFCAFPQSMGKNERVTAKTAKEMIDKLIMKGCSRCGSAPLKGNDVKYGQLTVNYVAKVCRHGVC